jgi:hypothetical protein
MGYLRLYIEIPCQRKLKYPPRFPLPTIPAAMPAAIPAALPAALPDYDSVKRLDF